MSTRLGHATVSFTLDTYSADIPDPTSDPAEDVGARRGRAQSIVAFHGLSPGAAARMSWEDARGAG